MPFPTNVFVPLLDAQFADLPDQYPYQVVSASESPEGALYVQVFTGAGYLWLKPGQFEVAA